MADGGLTLQQGGLHYKLAPPPATSCIPLPQIKMAACAHPLPQMIRIYCFPLVLKGFGETTSQVAAGGYLARGLTPKGTPILPQIKKLGGGVCELTACPQPRAVPRPAEVCLPFTTAAGMRAGLWTREWRGEKAGLGEGWTRGRLDWCRRVLV